jgi:hypothetical protein
MPEAAAASTKTTSNRTFSRERAVLSKPSRKEKLEEERSAKKLLKLEGIREHFRRKAAELNHYSLAETQQILVRLYTELAPHGIHATGDSRTRGDHFAFRITAEATGHSAFVGLALRGKEGFASGTVKKIIDNHMDNAMRLLGSKIG